MASKVGVKLIVFASREFEATDLDELVEQLDSADLPRDEDREYRSRIRDLRIYQGVTCSIELAFDFDQRLYIYELRPDWFDEFLELDEEVIARVSDDEMGDDTLGGYFSKN